MRNEDDLGEKSKFRFSHAKLFALSALLFLVLVACSFALSKTILAKWLNPAYIAQENQNTILKLAVALEDLEVKNKQQQQFINLLQSIIAGQELPEQAPQPVKAHPTPTPVSAQQAKKRAEADRMLRSDFESSDSSLLSGDNRPGSELQDFFLFPPVSGIITTPFRHKIGHYGVDIVA